MHTLIAAMPEVLKIHPDAQCVVIGGIYPAEPKYESQLREQVFELGIESRVTFAGSQSNVPLWMQAMDVAIHASKREPFGIVVVEAMALGKAVIAAVPGGPAEIIRDGVDGFLTDSADCVMLADRINQFLDDVTLRERLGAEANRQSYSRFSSDAYSHRLCEALSDLIQ
jgi:glycosyltransferase involved in cell wall biosynthesis